LSLLLDKSFKHNIKPAFFQVFTKAVQDHLAGVQWSSCHQHKKIIFPDLGESTMIKGLTALQCL